MGVDLENFDSNDFSSMETIRLNKILNFISHIFLFILPPLFYAKLISFEPKEVYLFRPAHKFYWMIFPLGLIFLTILNGLLFEWNHSLDFSFISDEFQETLVYEQAVREKAIYAYVGTTWKSYFVNLFLIALIPAIGEELTFRGVLQHLIGKATSNVYVGIVISALLFALIHFQPFNIIPIFVLGLAYGFIVMYTGSILITIALHFANNFISITMMHLTRYYGWEEYSTSVFIDLAIVLAAFVLIFYILKNKPELSKWNEVKGIYLR